MSTYECTALGLWGGESEDIIKRDFPIHRACRDGNLKLLREAWATASFDQLTAEDKFYGWTPIHWAAYFGKISCLSELLGFGVSVNLCTSKFKQTPCHIASFGGHPQCLLGLLQAGANFHARDYLGESPIHKAARVGNAECISVLLENGSRVNVCNNNGHTPCDLARMQNFLECVGILESASVQQMADQQCGIRNGASGMIMESLNGHHNGSQQNATYNGCIKFSNKRMFEDESIPQFKKGRFGFVNGNHVLEYSNGHDDSMDMDDSIPVYNRSQNDVLLVQNHKQTNDDFARAPSPGMDMNLNEEDMQLWCHENGYGDTAESMPSNTSTSCFKHRQAVKYEAGYDRAVCAHLRGIQARGWH